MTIRSRIVGAVALVLLGAAFLAGYWPERQLRRAAEDERAALAAQVSALEDRVRAARLHAELLNVIGAVEAMNYGQAQAQSSALFDAVRTEVGRTRDSDLRALFGDFLAARDTVTSALAKGDAGVRESLHGFERKFRQILSAPLPGA